MLAPFPKGTALQWGYYFGARYYDPVIGRWMAVDPLAGKYPSLSSYAYCKNSPINFFDPNGLEPILISNWYFLFTRDVYLTEREKLKWYNALDNANIYFLNMGFTGISEWISNYNFYVIIRDYKDNIAGEADVGRMRMKIGSKSIGEELNVVYAHELAHLRGYDEFGAYATTAAILGIAGKEYVLRQLEKYFKFNPRSIDELPKGLRGLFISMKEKSGDIPAKAAIFYSEYQKWGKQILINFEDPNSAKAGEQGGGSPSSFNLATRYWLYQKGILEKRHVNQ